MTGISQIKESYKDGIKDLIEGTLSFSLEGPTAGPSHEGEVFEVFEKLGLGTFSHFLDLGSGDGRIVFVASLFTKATGIEVDAEQHAKAVEKSKSLRLHPLFKQGDFMEESFKDYDVIFIYPDAPFKDGLEKKLREEFKGTLIVYGSLYLPLRFKKVAEYAMPLEKISVYDCKRQV